MTTTPCLQQVLSSTAWFQELPLLERDRVFADVYEEDVDAGGLVARKGDVARSWIGVATGLLKISAVYRSGKVVMFTGVPEGSWVGEGSVVKRELRRYDIVAMRRSRIIHLPAATFRWLLDTSIDFNRIIVHRLNERLGST